MIIITLLAKPHSAAYARTGFCTVQGPPVPVVVLSLALLTRVESLIREHSLHDAGESAPGPVDIQTLLEEYRERFRPMPYFVQAMTLLWKERDGEQMLFALNDWLEEPEASADRRHARVHEFAHLFAKHRGDKFIMWSADIESQCEGLENYIHHKQEHQCECVAALLLVPLWMLEELKGNDEEYVAGVLDVPPHLVALRWAIYRRLGR